MREFDIRGALHPDSRVIVAVVRTALTAHSIREVALINGGRHSWDMGLLSDGGISIIVRLVLRPTPSDHIALKTMLAEGDFDRAVLVYCDEDEFVLSDDLESWPISRIDELAAVLAAEAAPA